MQGWSGFLTGVGALAAFTMLTVGLSGCDSNGDRPWLSDAESRRLSDRINEASDSTSPTLLSSLTEFPWSTVSIFGEATSAADIAEATGFELHANYVESPYIMVFCEQGNVITVANYGYGDVLSSGNATYDSSFTRGGWGSPDISRREVAPDCGQ